MGSYTVIEQYRDDEHYKAIPEVFGAFMAGPPDIRVFASVDS